MSNLTLDLFKTAVDNKLNGARADLILRDEFYPVLLVSTKEGVEEFELDLDEDNKEDSAKVIKGHCSKPGVLAVAMVFNAYTLAQSADEEQVIGSLENNKKAMETIMVYVYTKDECHYRRAPYVRQGEKKYWFGDEGWKEFRGLVSGLFSNPFTKE